MTSNTRRLKMPSGEDILANVLMPPQYENCLPEDDVWFAVIGNKSRTDKKPLAINFCVPITPYPNQRFLTDPEFEKDLATVKYLLMECVRPAPRGWVTSRKTLMRVYDALLIFVRTRVSMGINSNRDLTPEAKRLYISRLRKGGYFALIDYSERTDTIIAAFDSNRIRIPLNDRKEVAFDIIAPLFGVGNIAALPGEEVRRLKRYFTDRGVKFREVSRKSGAPKISKNKLSIQRAIEIILPWLWLGKFRDNLIHDPIPFRPYMKQADIEREVKLWVNEKGATKELRPNQVVYLLSKSLQLLTDPLTPFLINVVATLEPTFELAAADRDFINSRLSALGLGILSQEYKQRDQSFATVSLRTLALVFLPIAFACVYSMGTARRKDETDSQELGKVYTDEQGQLWLLTPIRKLKNHSVGKDAHTATIPISETVKLAVDIMEKLKRATGHPSNYLFDLLDPVTGTGVDIDFSKRVKSYAKWLNLPPSDDGSETELAAHQFRKFFAITYFYRYRFPSLPALSLHMLHLNLDVTRAYLASAARNSLQIRDEAKSAAKKHEKDHNDINRLEDFEEIGRGFVFDILLSATRGEIKLAGTAGLHLMRDLAKLTERLGDVVDVHDSVEADDALNSLLQQFASGKTFRPHPEGHGFCACDQTQSCLMAANCLRAKSIELGVDITTFNDVDHGYAEDLTCGTCVHHFILPDLWPYWDNEITRCEAALENARGEQYEVLAERLAGLRDYEASVVWQWAA
ncbi:hypothetical protein ACCC98_02805 [Rhizobium pisi]|uniref:hypothetical protein n=1 Tax=Rhizobium pisi TaxID=574561 RepID=UPI0039B10834